MTLNADALQRLSAAPKKEAVPLWRPPTMEDIKPGRVLAFDQSLSGCAAVALIRTETGLTVLSARSFKPLYVAAGGHEQNLQQCVDLTSRIRQWINDLGGAPAEWCVVHEAPPIGGGKLVRPESSLLAAASVRHASWDYRLAPMVARRAHAKFVCGKADASKKDHHAALMDLASRWTVTGLGEVSNEGKRDAFSVGLYHLARSRG